MKQRGFTLVEMIVAMVVLGIVAGMVAVFVQLPVRGYQSSVLRAELVDTADLSLRRMARDIRLALPGSVVVSADNRSIGFLQTKYGGRYLATEDGPTSGAALSFLDTTQKTFNVLTSMPTGRQAIAVGDHVVVYNLGTGFSPADAYTLGNIAQVAAVDTTNGVITMDANPFAAQNPPMPSPSSRFFIVSGAVWYTCTAGANGSGTLMRYTQTNTNTGGASTAPASASGALMAKNVQDCGFTVANVATRNSALVALTLTLNSPTGSDGAVVLTDQVHIDNTP